VSAERILITNRHLQCETEKPYWSQNITEDLFCTIHMQLCVDGRHVQVLQINFLLSLD
jgi:hypothetical protein